MTRSRYPLLRFPPRFPRCRPVAQHALQQQAGSPRCHRKLSPWCLPATRGIPVKVRQVDARRVRIQPVRGEAQPVEGLPPPSAPCLTDAEHRRHQARVDVFTARGLVVTDARKLADALLDRDRGGLRATGSCVECQCVELKDCPTTPRPALQIHPCWYMRRCTS